MVCLAVNGISVTCSKPVSGKMYQKLQISKNPNVYYITTDWQELNGEFSLLTSVLASILCAA